MAYNLEAMCHRLDYCVVLPFRDLATNQQMWYNGGIRWLPEAFGNMVGILLLLY